jgi:DNA-binding protein H-NS
MIDATVCAYGGAPHDSSATSAVLYAFMNNPFISSAPATSLSDGPADNLPVLRARADAVRWVRLQMARHGITLPDLVAAGCFAAKEGRGVNQASFPIRYRNADGRIWDGVGELPDWLQRAVNAGQSVEHFRID